MLMLHDGGYSQRPARDTSSHDILSHNILPATSGRKTPCPRHPAAKRPARDILPQHPVTKHLITRGFVTSSLPLLAQKQNEQILPINILNKKRMIAQSTQSPIMEIFIAQNVTTCNIFSHRLWITFYITVFLT